MRNNNVSKSIEENTKDNEFCLRNRRIATANNELVKNNLTMRDNNNNKSLCNKDKGTNFKLNQTVYIEDTAATHSTQRGTQVSKCIVNCKSNSSRVHHPISGSSSVFTRYLNKSSHQIKNHRA